jgi:hypothetical protein
MAMAFRIRPLRKDAMAHFSKNYRKRFSFFKKLLAYHHGVSDWIIDIGVVLLWMRNHKGLTPIRFSIFH